MKLLLCTFLVLAVHVYAQSSPYLPPDPEVFWYTQVFDHFNSSDSRTFQQRYLIYDQYYVNDTGNIASGSGPVPVKPIFFCPGGEADVNGGYQHNGFMFQFGIKLSAFQLFPEHRFFGQSLPFGDEDSFLPGNIDKLTIEQALEDYVTIISYVMQQHNLPSNTPIIAFGGSYPGELAAFLRLSFSNVVDGALASSAPVRYHPGLPDATSSGAFYAVVTADFAKKQPECPGVFQSALSQIQLLYNSAEGRQAIQRELQLCAPLDGSSQQLRLLNLWIENAFAELGMENYPYPLDGFPAFPVEYACSKLLDGVKRSPIYGLGQAVGVDYNVTGTLSCFNISEEYYPCADITGCGPPSEPDARSWDYLSCTEIVSNVDTNGNTDMFVPAPYNFTRVVEYCQEKWSVTPDPLLIPQKYNYTGGQNIIFSNGFLDPWWPGGVLKSSADGGIIALQMHQAAHHLDLRGSDNDDPVSVQDVRQKEENIIVDWLNAIGTTKTIAFPNRAQQLV